MLKLFKKNKTGDFERYGVPRSIQKSLPIKEIHRDGIWGVGDGRFSQTWKFDDINYDVASPEDKEDLFLGYSNLLNALPTDGRAQITINNRKLNSDEFKRDILVKEIDDNLLVYRKEYNEMIKEKAATKENMVQEKYITISSAKKSVTEARPYFFRIGNEISSHLGKIGSKLHVQNTHDRLQTLHRFFRSGEEQFFSFDQKRTMRLGADFKDYICPDSLQFKSDHFIMGEKVGRVLFLKDFASFIKDSMIAEFCEVPKNLMLSIDIEPVSTDLAVKEADKKIMAIESDINRWQQKQNMQNNFSATIPYQMDQMRSEVKEFMDDLTTRDQRMMFVVVTLVHIADTLEELDHDTENFLSIGRKHLCQLAKLNYQQEDGLNSALPYGLRRVNALRTLTTESTAVLGPFYSQEILEKGGAFYGLNAISNNIIICNRKNLQNGNGFILGVPGSGKSFTAKLEIVNTLLATGDDVILIDPEREYGPITNAFDGELINISASSPHRINALDISAEYAEGESPIAIKSEFILSLCEQLMGSENLGPKERSLIDRCVELVLTPYIKSKYKGTPPTLKDFYDKLLEQPEEEARSIALSIELFVTGSLNIFAHQTNVDLDNRLMCYDILDLGKQLKTVGMLVMLDAVMNRVAKNRKIGRRTHIVIDEIYLFFLNEYSSNFLNESWKRFRKYGALATGITQNISDCLQTHMGRNMLSNSEFLVMLNQSPTDRIELANLLHISDTQMEHITNASEGHGLIKYGGSIVPFANLFPKDTELYKMMSTKPEDMVLPTASKTPLLDEIEE